MDILGIEPGTDRGSIVVAVSPPKQVGARSLVDTVIRTGPA